MKKILLNSNESNPKFSECWDSEFNMIYDGLCHDSTNTEACDYDGGDCCLDEIVKACSSCICHEDGLVHPYNDPYGKESPNNMDLGGGYWG